MDRIAFVHIPKTAGRSVVHAFEHALGEANCTAFAPAIDDAAFTNKRFVSAHIQLSEITPDAFAFTFLREPIAQLASHLRWLDRYNDPVFWEEVIPFSPSIREAITRIGQTDFVSARSVAAFFEWLPEFSHARLLNVQCEVLAARSDSQAYTNQAEMAEVAIANLARLHFVGLTEHLKPDMARLFAALNLPGPPLITRQNLRSSLRRINLRDPDMHDVLGRQLTADLRLYHHVRAQPQFSPLQRLRDLLPRVARLNRSDNRT
jgi:hypothetical protein